MESQIKMIDLRRSLHTPMYLLDMRYGSPFYRPQGCAEEGRGAGMFYGAALEMQVYGRGMSQLSQIPK